ncbi:sensor histidine kinase [Alkaliphilus serpentinus]|uniref:GHKL domain-containing protein n=1 Tax=Alkaliphilus serpentinus TaxID=1482731 RepID=A0A833M983_9FIRM|nr:GHKL domain-containing protein [Alkaliphilus serpentinus]KAB3532827.1 GHKL domain-containing protein [Alkaliphilus serpentinus]
MNRRNLLIISCSAQIIMIMVIAIGLMGSDHYQIIRKWLHLLIGLIFIFTLFNFYIIYSQNKTIEKEKELAIIKTELKTTEALIDLLRQQGHDHINHIQTVTSMLMLEENAVALEYLQGISAGYRFTGHFLRLGNPTLTALINTKKELANKNGIEFVVEKYCRVKLNKIKPWDISSIIGNLLENSIEYILMNEDLPPKIFFSVENRENMKGYIFRIGNPYKSSGINTDVFFQQGFSTKESTGRGYGLNIVMELIEKYKGTIKITESEGRITFTVEVDDE